MEVTSSVLTIVRRALFTIIILSLSCLLVFCTKEKPKPIARAVQIIIENYSVYEPNPIHSDEAKKLTEFFRYTLNNRNKLEPAEQKEIYSRAMALHKVNGEAEEAIEDAVDEHRVMIRASMTMAIAALVSEPKEAVQYFERAKDALTIGGKTSESMEDQYSGLLVLESLYLSEHKIIKEADKEAMIGTINGFDNLSEPKDSFIAVIQKL